jgi:DNA-binding transcriptional LysR family regulator
VKSIIRINSSKNQMNISSRQLDAFIALAQLGSFTLAAQRCHLSQPAFSALIKGLEEGVGVRLFDRSTRHVALTQEGAQFLDAAQRIRTDLGDAVQGLREAAALQRGRVSIALLPSLAAAWLPPVLALFHARHPPRSCRPNGSAPTGCTWSAAPTMRWPPCPRRAWPT